jgi:positive regulator of sigma E activity
MKRLARVIARSGHSVIVKLVQSEKCVGCPTNCNKPLIDLFSLRKNYFTLTANNTDYLLVDEQNLLQQPKLLDQLIQLEINSSDMMKSSALMYFLPLVLCLMLVMIGHYVGLYLNVSSDLMALLGLLLGLIIFYFFVSKKKSSLYLKFRPKVTIL